MSALACLDAVAAPSFRALSCEVDAGQSVRVMFAVQEQREELWDILTGLRAPRRGRVSLLGQDLYALAEPSCLQVLQRVGVVAQDGGLISNLKVWENIVLPAWYHRGAEVATWEQAVVRILRDCGLDPGRMHELARRLPDQLNAGERCIVALARALLMQPDIMIYDSPFTGVERDLAARLLRVMTEYHRARAGRAAIFLLPDEPFSERVPVDVTVTLEA